MLDVIFQFVLGYVVALSGALIPGPLLTFVISGTLNHGGAETGFLAGLGHCIVEAFIILAIIFGLTSLLEQSLFQMAVNMVGGAALIVFGVLNIRATGKMQHDRVDSKLNHGSIIGGILFTVFNATIPLWWATVGLTMLNQALKTTTMLGVVLWVLGHWSADLSWFGFVGYSVFKGKNHVGKKVHSLIILTCGVVLISLGIIFTTSSLKILFQ